MKEFEYKGRPHGRIDSESAYSLWKQGATDADIAAAFGMTPRGVASWRHRNGMKPNKKCPAQKEEARSIVAINAEARAAGMTYGQHTALPVNVRGHIS